MNAARAFVLALTVTSPSGAQPDAAKDVLPDLVFAGVDDAGRDAVVRLHEHHDPTGPAGAIVVRVQGGTWCGTCDWHAAHTRELLAFPRVHVVDVLLGNPDAEAATLADARAWRRSLDVATPVAVDPAFSLRPFAQEGALVLPLVLVVDTRTMHVANALANPDPGLLAGAVARVVGSAPPAPEPLVDGLFHRNEWDMVRAIGEPVDAAPPEDPALVALGRALFADRGLSASGTVSCASCHDPAKGLSDGRPVAVGLGAGTRRTPRIALASRARHLFWDGRASSLEAQAREPLLAEHEMGATPASVAAYVRQAFPPTSSDEDVVTEVTRAISAYERTFQVVPDAVDRYARGDTTALAFPEKQGLVMFARAGCVQCHWGPRLTDDAFHTTHAHGDVGYLGTSAFKTPSLRGVAQGAPFGHRGEQATLTDVLVDYSSANPEHRDPWLPRFGETMRWSIERFLLTLTSAPVGSPALP